MLFLGIFPGLPVDAANRAAASLAPAPVMRAAIP
jgi:hypothetical protein